VDLLFIRVVERRGLAEPTAGGNNTKT